MPKQYSEVNHITWVILPNGLCKLYVDGEYKSTHFFHGDKDIADWERHGYKIVHK